MECNVCKTENPSDSLFCLECGASININNGFVSKIKDEDRMVSAKEFKDRIYSISFPKSKHAHRLFRKELQREIERWKNDPEYIPLIGTPMKDEDEVKFIPTSPSNIMLDDNGNCTHNTDFECGLKKNCNLPLGSEYKSLVNVEDRLRSIIPNVPNINRIYGDGEPIHTPIGTMDFPKIEGQPQMGMEFIEFVKQAETNKVELFSNELIYGVTIHTDSNNPVSSFFDNKTRMITLEFDEKDYPLVIKGGVQVVTSIHTEEKKEDNYPNNIDGFDDPCGVCGSDKCLEIHKPTIQEQYQEAFENIQRFRRNRLERWKYEQELKELQIKVANGLMPPPLYRIPIYRIPIPENKYPELSNSERPFPIFEMRKGWDSKPSLARKTTKTRTGIHDTPEEMRFIPKGIRGSGTRKPKKPFASISIRKGLDRKKRKTPKQRRGAIEVMKKRLRASDAIKTFETNNIPKRPNDRSTKVQWIKK